MTSKRKKAILNALMASVLVVSTFGYGYYNIPFTTYQEKTVEAKKEESEVELKRKFKRAK